jgi:hypothetical protein
MFIVPVNSSLTAQSYSPVLQPSLTAQSYRPVLPPSLTAQSYRPVLPPSLTAQSYGDIERRQREVAKSQNAALPHGAT